LERFIGYCYVSGHEGDLTAEDATRIMEKSRKAEIEAEGAGHEASKRILVRGDVTMTEAAAQVFADEGILLYGNESQTVGPIEAPRQIHLIMLGAEIVLLEGIRLSGVEDGIYLLDAAPLNLGGADGAPCRAILIRE
ncbi:MAG: cyclase, partial [Eubacterium sp.]|nr:cyclase [Eubacterium sp.]